LTGCKLSDNFESGSKKHLKLWIENMFTKIALGSAALTIALTLSGMETVFVVDLTGESHYERGLKYEKAGDIEQAIASYKEAALLGHVSAQFTLGALYQKGSELADDVNKMMTLCDQAIEWYVKAAEQHHVYAQNNLGAIYVRKAEYETDPSQKEILFKQGLNYFHAAAEQNYLPALVNYTKTYSAFREISQKEREDNALLLQAQRILRQKTLFYNAETQFDAAVKLIEKTKSWEECEQKNSALAHALTLLKEAAKKGYKPAEDRNQDNSQKREKPLRSCSNCGTKKMSLSKCGRCKKAYYCNADCQRKDWAEHKKRCEKK
jgi:hypothetical protein